MVWRGKNPKIFLDFHQRKFKSCMPFAFWNATTNKQPLRTIQAPADRPLQTNERTAMVLCRNPVVALVLWWVVFVLATINEVSMVEGFVLRCVFPAGAGAESSVLADNCPLVTMFSTKNGHDEPESESTTTTTTTTTTCGQQEPQNGMAKKKKNNNNNDDDAVVGWIQRMTDYLSSEKEAIFSGNNVAMILNSSPSRECLEIALMISGIASEADHLYFVVSPQDDEETNNNSNDSDKEEISFINLANSISSSNIHSKTVESIDFHENVLTAAIDVVVLSTKSSRVVEDSFVNDFLRRTDAWIHMGSEFGDDFCLHARLQEGANITLW
jgi:hypothetical protein